MNMNGRIAITYLILVSVFADARNKSAPITEFTCVGMINGDHIDWNNPCSTTYISCHGGVKRMMNCHPGLIYDMITGQCRYKKDVWSCCDNIKNKPVLSDQYFNCIDKPDADYKDTIAPCSSRYFQCVYGTSWIRHCPSGLVYDGETQVCIEKADIPGCFTRKPVCSTD